MSYSSASQLSRKRKAAISVTEAIQASTDSYTDYCDYSDEDSMFAADHNETENESMSSLDREPLESKDDTESDLEINDILRAEDLELDVYAYIKTLKFKLRKWAVKNNIKLLALSELLKILKEKGHTSLPKDARTLLETPQKVEIAKMGSGEFWYGGLKEKLTELCKKNNHGSKLVELNIHIDGTPVYKNSKAEFWPVQCDIKNIEMKPFFVEIYQGSSKPTSAELFLRPLLNEIHELSSDGLSVIINGKQKMFDMRIDKFILDAPARSFLKCIIGHGGYFSCERCEERGEYLCKVAVNAKNKRSRNKAKNAGHVCLTGTNAPLRTDETFRSKENEEHHHSTSPLEELSIDMVRDIPLEYLHLILYGGMKRLLTLWVDGTRYFKFSKTDIEEISKKHEKVGLTKPTELNKPTRSLKCLSFWKATEFRTFILKTGPIVLRDHLTEEIYNHFLTLHCAVTICCSKSLLMYLPVAKQLFRSFTERFGDLYGDENKTYSIHSLIHVTDDVERFGVFDEYSAFPGENNLGFLKSLVRGGHLPLQQVVRRIAEREACEKICEFEDIANNIKEELLNGGILRLKGLRLDSSEKNGWILTKNKDILKIISINKREKIKIRGAVLLKQNQENLYEIPIASKSLCIYKSKLDSMPMSIDIEDIYCKLYRIEISSEKSAFIPLYHHTQ